MSLSQNKPVSSSATWGDSVLAWSPAAGLPSRHSPRQGCADKAGASAEGCQFRAVRLDEPLPCSSHGPHKPRYGSSRIVLLPNGVINQSFYRDGSHKTSCFTVRVKRERKKGGGEGDKGLGSKRRSKTTIFVQRGWSRRPRESPASGEPVF